VEAGGVAREVDVPAPAPGAAENSVATTTVRFPAVTGNRLKVTVVSARRLMTLDWYSERQVALPVAIAELGIAGVRASAPDTIPAGCRNDLLTLDGRPVSIAVDAARAVADDRQGVTVRTCGPDAAGVTLDAGTHELRTRSGRDTGIDLDRLVLESPAPATEARAENAPVAPVIDIEHQGRTSYDLLARDVDGPFWLVLGQSHNRGWSARASGRSLGPPQLVNGYANGWYVDPGEAGTVDISLRWTPQRRVWWGLGLSLAGVLACVVLAVLDPRRADPRARKRARAAARKQAALTPEPSWPLEPEPAPGRPVSARAVAGTTLATGLGAALVAGVPIGAIVAAAVLVVLTRPRLHAVLGFGSALLLALAGLYTAVQQFRYDYLPQFEWPTRFHRAHLVAWLAVCLLVADVVVDLVRRGRPERPES
jgi:hypothetical protein